MSSHACCSATKMTKYLFSKSKIIQEAMVSGLDDVGFSCNLRLYFCEYGRLQGTVRLVSFRLFTIIFSHFVFVYFLSCHAVVWISNSYSSHISVRDC